MLQSKQAEQKPPSKTFRGGFSKNQRFR